MITQRHGNVFRITPWYYTKVTTGLRWICHKGPALIMMTSFDASLLKVWSNSRIVKLPMIVNVIMLVWRHFHDCPPPPPPAFIRHRYDCIDFKLLSYRFVRTTKKNSSRRRLFKSYIRTDLHRQKLLFAQVAKHTDLMGINSWYYYPHH